MSPFFKSLFKGNDRATKTIIVEKIEEIFEYVRLEDLCCMGIKDWTVRWKDTPVPLENELAGIVNPPHIIWSMKQKRAIVALTENGVEYYLSDDGANFCCQAEATNAKKDIEFIDKLFSDLYETLELPESLEKLRLKQSAKQAKKGESSGDKYDLLKEYLRIGASEYFHDTLSESDDLLIWVDWREEDASIVDYCEDILKTGELSAEDINSDDDPLGFEVIITYKGTKHKVNYPGEGADRDTTIITLNEVLQPDFEIRFCKDSNGSDTLAFLPLSVSQWSELENEFGAKKVTACFAKIEKGSKMFG